MEVNRSILQGIFHRHHLELDYSEVIRWLSCSQCRRGHQGQVDMSETNWLSFQKSRGNALSFREVFYENLFHTKKQDTRTCFAFADLD